MRLNRKLWVILLGLLPYAAVTIAAGENVTVSIMEWKTPSDPSGPYAMAADALGRIWFFETRTQPNQLVGFDPRSEEFFVTAPVPSGGGSVRHMVYDQVRNSLWFGTDTNNLGRAHLP